MVVMEIVPYGSTEAEQEVTQNLPGITLLIAALCFIYKLFCENNALTVLVQLQLLEPNTTPPSKLYLLKCRHAHVIKMPRCQTV